MHSWSTFDAHIQHGQTLIHKIHHGPHLVEATTFPLIIFYMFSHKACAQMSFLSQDSQGGSFEIPEIGVPTILEVHNFLYKLPLIKVKFKTKF